MVTKRDYWPGDRFAEQMKEGIEQSSREKRKSRERVKVLVEAELERVGMDFSGAAKTIGLGLLCAVPPAAPAHIRTSIVLSFVCECHTNIISPREYQSGMSGICLRFCCVHNCA